MGENSVRKTIDKTPVSLLRRLRTADRVEAWDEFVDLYLPILFCWTRRLKLQDADAADLVQDVMTVLVKKLPTFEYDHSLRFRGWLRTVLLNRWRELERKRRPADIADNIQDFEAPVDDLPFWEHDHRKMVLHRLLDMVRPEFSPATWQACWLSVVEGYSAKDVATKLNLTEGAVRAAKFRVLSRLRLEAADLLD